MFMLSKSQQPSSHKSKLKTKLNLQQICIDQESINHDLFHQYLLATQYSHQYIQTIVKQRLAIANSQQLIAELKSSIHEIYPQTPLTEHVSECELDIEIQNTELQYQQLRAENEDICLQLKNFDATSNEVLIKKDAEFRDKCHFEITSLDKQLSDANRHLASSEILHEALKQTLSQTIILPKIIDQTNDLEKLRTQLQQLHELDDTLGFLTLNYQELSAQLDYTTNPSCRAALHWRLAHITKDQTQYAMAIHHFYWAYYSNNINYQNALQEIESIQKLIYKKPPQKKWLKLAKEAYEQQNNYQAIMCALLALSTTQKEEYIASCRILINVYLKHEDWPNVANVYELLSKLEVTKQTEVSIIEKALQQICTQFELSLQNYLTFPSLPNKLKALQITATQCYQVFARSLERVDNSSSEGLRPATCSLDPEILPHEKAHCTEMGSTESCGQAAGLRESSCQHALIKPHDIISDLITNYQTQLDNPCNSIISLRILTIILIEFYVQTNQLLAIKNLMDSENIYLTDQQCPVLLGWIHYQCALAYEANHQFSLAKQHYTYASTMEPSNFMEARAACKRFIVHQHKPISPLTLFSPVVSISKKIDLLSSITFASEELIAQQVLPEESMDPKINCISVTATQTNASTVECPHHVVLPSSLLSIMRELYSCRELNPSQIEIYLSGSTVHRLLLGQPLDDPFLDIDLLLITNYMPTTKLHFANFKQNFILNNHYVRNKQVDDEYSVDVMVISKSIYDYAHTSDLYLCALYIDIHGKVFDPTNEGWNYLIKKSIQSIEDPSESIRKDPVRLLRMLKYQCRNYQPSDAVSAAILSWDATNCLHNSHFAYVLAAALTSIYRVQYLLILKEYNLIEKIWGNSFVGMTKPEDLCQHLATRLYQHIYCTQAIVDTAMPIQSSTVDLQTFLTNTQEHYYYLSKQLAQAEQEELKLCKRQYGITKQAILLEDKAQKLAHKFTTLQKTVAESKSRCSQKEDKLSMLKSLYAEELEKNTQYLTTLRKKQRNLESKIKKSLHKKEKSHEQQLTIKQQVMDNVQEKFMILDDEILSMQQRVKNAQTTQEALILKQEQDKIDLITIKRDISIYQQKIQQKQDERIAKKIQPINSLKKFSFLKQPLDQLECAYKYTTIPELKFIISAHLGQLALINGDYFKAFNYFINANPKDLEITEKIAFITQQITTHHLSPTLIESSDAKVWVEHGLIAKKQHRIDEALFYYHNAIMHEPTEVNAYIARINIFFRTEQWMELLNDYEVLSQKLIEKIETQSILPSNNIKDISKSICNKLIKKDSDYSQKTTEITNNNELLNIYWKHVSIIIYKKYSMLSPILIKKSRLIFYEEITARSLDSLFYYSLAHIEMSYIYANSDNFYHANIHYKEALFVYPEFAEFMPEKLQQYIEPSSRQTTIEELFEQSAIYELKFCHNHVLETYETIIKTFPNDPQGYWSFMNYCITVHGAGKLSEERINQFIYLLTTLKDTLNIIEYHCYCYELHLYKNDFFEARRTYQTLTTFYPEGILPELKLKNLEHNISIELIDLLANTHKEEWTKILENPECMKNPTNIFMANRELGKYYLYNDELDKALTHLLTANALLEVDDHSYLLKCDLLKIYILNGDVDNAQIEYDFLLEHTPKENPIYPYIQMVIEYIFTPAAINLTP